MKSQNESNNQDPNNQGKDLLEEFFSSISKANAKLLQQMIKAMNVQSFNLPNNNLNPFAEIWSGIFKDPKYIWEVQSKIYQQQLELWTKFLSGNTTTQEDSNDKRFESTEWTEHPFYNYLKQSYLISSNWLLNLVDTFNSDSAAKEKMHFFTQQFIDAMSPTNFAATNPEVLKRAIETQGASLVEGMKNMLSDMEKGSITMSDTSNFKIGENIASTQGAVIYRNSLIELIQYTPKTDKVYEKPLLVVPPCINKYYLMDLSPDKSMIQYLIEQGYTVFLISWKSADDSIRNYQWDNYINQGVMESLSVVKQITKAEKVNTLGFCIGGVILTTALVVLKAQKKDWVQSAVFMTSLVDASKQPGEITYFIDENLIKAREAQVLINKGGIVAGKELAGAFSALRANDLIWNYVINNYLLGKTPPPFDLLYWNNDPVDLPMPMHNFFIRNMYLENNLIKKGEMQVCGVPVDLSEIDIPLYFFAAEADHIVIWRGVFDGIKYFGSKEKRFVVGASGHIAGSINPVKKDKRNYWVNEKLDYAESDEWFKDAKSEPGSWWKDLNVWLGSHSGKKSVAAPKVLGSADFKVLDDAPGNYVKHRTTELVSR